MPLTLDITSAWEATNDAGAALASALHAIRTDAIDTPVILRRPAAQRFSEKDRLGEALLLVAESKRHAAAALRRIEAVESTIQQQLATR
jgi:hypothetical protein